MKSPLYVRVNSTRPLAVLALTNTFGAAIFDIDGDECVTAWHNGNYYYNAHRNKIYYSSSDRAYIRKGSLRLYLDQFIRLA